jgi:hypothetical protein
MFYGKFMTPVTIKRKQFSRKVQDATWKQKNVRKFRVFFKRKIWLNT